jgi:hypothetical protein
MHYRKLIPAIFTLIAFTAFAQSVPVTTDKRLVAAVSRALNFKEGDRDGFMGIQREFTPSGWQEFLNSMKGYFDSQGGPSFTSSFTPWGGAKEAMGPDGAIQMTIPGTLKQTSGKSPAMEMSVNVDVQLVGNPLRIEHFKKTLNPKNAGTR